jgi:predicted SAM-dependent methyltransferase
MSRKDPDPGAFDEFVHHTLRTPELARLPAGARTVLSGGCAGSWYFEWFAEQYPTPIERHIGVDAYAPEPDGLPVNVDWVSSSLGDLRAVEDGSVDLVYAGQTIEHLWPEEVVGFLCEAHRVLRPGGRLALDSTNRRVTVALDWNHPEHTIEFTPDEILELLRLAGFVDAEIRGLWLCFDESRQRFLRLDDLAEEGSWPQSRRLEKGRSRPNDCFIWWVEAVRGTQAPERSALEGRLAEMYEPYRLHRLGRFQHQIGKLRRSDGTEVITARKGERGHLLFGPYLPMPPGSWVASFHVSAGPPRMFDRLGDGEALGEVDVAVGSEARIVAERKLTSGSFTTDGRIREVAVPFDLPRSDFGVQFRLRSTGRLRLSAEPRVDIEPASIAEAGVSERAAS